MDGEEGPLMIGVVVAVAQQITGRAVVAEGIVLIIVLKKPMTLKGNVCFSSNTFLCTGLRLGGRGKG